MSCNSENRQSTPVDLHRLKMNLSSTSSRSIRSALICSCAMRIRTCSTFTASRANELSSLSSNTMKSGIWWRKRQGQQRARSAVANIHLGILLCRESTNDKIGSLLKVLEYADIIDKISAVPLASLSCRFGWTQCIQMSR